MTYVSQPINDSVSSVKYPEPFNASLVAAAREVYSSYSKTHSGNLRRPAGVVIHRETWRGQLIFKGKPILLPHEYFVPLEQIESIEPS